MTIQDDKSQHKALRPPPPKRSFTVRHIVLLFAGLLAMWGVWQIIWIATGKPAPVIDYIPRINALVEQYQPEGENGWPILVEAMKRADEANLAAINELDDPLDPELELHFFALYRPNLEHDYADSPGVLDTTLERRALELYESEGVFELLDRAAAHARMVRTLPATGQPLIDVQLPELAPFRALATALAAQMSIAQEQNDEQAVVRAFEQCLVISRACCSQATIIDRLVGYAVFALAVSRTTSLIASAELSDDTLRELSRAMKRQGELPPHALVFEVERLSLLDMIQRCFSDDGHGSGRLDFDKLGRITGGTAPGGRLAGMFTAGRRESTEKVNELMDEMIRLSRQRAVERAGAIAELDQVIENLGFRHMFVRMFMPALTKTMQQAAMVDQLRTAFHISIAIERHRAARGAYPRDLASLVPEFLDDVPLDPLHGKQFLYRRLDDSGCVLYSTGIDLVDDSANIDWASFDRSRKTGFRVGEDFVLNLTLPPKHSE